MNRGVGKKGICRIWFIGADIFLPHCLVTGIWNLAPKAINGPKSRGTSFNTTLWYRVQRDCAHCVLFSNVQLVKKYANIELAKHRELLLVPVSFFAHEKGGIFSLTVWRQVSETWLQKRSPGGNLVEHCSIGRFGTASRLTALLVFCVACAVSLELKFLPHSWVKNMQVGSAKHRKLLLVPV